MEAYTAHSLLIHASLQISLSPLSLGHLEMSVVQLASEGWMVVVMCLIFAAAEKEYYRKKWTNKPLLLLVLYKSKNVHVH